MAITDLPALNASLNLLATMLLAAGYYWIRRGHRERHKRCMVGACACSAAFLASYLVYHWHVGSVPFEGRGLIRPIYFAVLVSHIVLAAVIVPLVALTLAHAWQGSFERHRRLARWTWPLWMYVSVTGVAICGMLYHL